VIVAPEGAPDGEDDVAALLTDRACHPGPALTPTCGRDELIQIVTDLQQWLEIEPAPIDYHTARAQQEAQLARSARSVAARDVHLRLAALHEQRAAG
jgi:hypothetical protein